MDTIRRRRIRKDLPELGVLKQMQIQLTKHLHLTERRSRVVVNDEEASNDWFREGNGLKRKHSWDELTHR